MPSVSIPPLRREEPDPAEVVRQEADCEARRKAIDRLYEDAGHCKVDADCSVVRPGAPFGCLRAVNRTADLTAVLAATSAYGKTCRTGHYRCVDLDTHVVCSADKCVWPIKAKAR
jgi:hypothetical protein